MRLHAGYLMLEERCWYRSDGKPPIKFTPKEAHLLAIFLEHPDQVVSRATLMKEVWQTDYMGDTRTLDVHICWLRRKLEEDPDHPQLLRTRRGVGYALNVPETVR